MNRSLAAASALGLALAVSVTGARHALAQTAPSPWPAPTAAAPQTAPSPWPAPTAAAPQAAPSPWPTPTAAAPQAVPGAPKPTDCNDFVRLRDDAQQKASLVKAASEHKDDRKGMCTAITHFAAAEGAALKFLTDNMTWCGIPQQVVANAKATHEKTVQFATMVCSSNAPGPKPPTLSDAIGTPAVDSGQNTRTGQGTLDTLTGNPLAK